MKKFLFITLILDQLTKIAVVKYLSHKQIVVTDFFNIALVYNKGISFGLFNNYASSNYFFLLACLFIVAFLFYLLKQSQDKTEDLGLSLVIGGAIGNIIDRIIHPGVVDFLEFHWQQYYWPSFNIADSAICLGVCILIFFSLRYKKS